MIDCVSFDEDIKDLHVSQEEHKLRDHNVFRYLSTNAWNLIISYMHYQLT